MKNFIVEASSAGSAPRNGDLPGWESPILQEKIQRITGQLLEIFLQTGNKPIIELRFEDEACEPCFTNAGMDKVLNRLMGDLREQLVETIVINPYQYPGPELLSKMRDMIVIVGGSVNDTYDGLGQTLSHCFSDPFFQVVNDARRNVRALMICFGYQLILEAFGRFLNTRGHKDVLIETFIGEPEFCLSLAEITDKNTFLEFLVQVRILVALTHEGFVVTHNHHFKQLQRLARQYGISLHEIFSYVSPEKILIDRKRPHLYKGLMPLGVQIGNIVAVQFHPEYDSQDPEVTKPVQAFLDLHPSISGDSLFSPEVRSLAPVFFTGLFEKFADDIHQFWVQKNRLRKKKS